MVYIFLCNYHPEWTDDVYDVMEIWRATVRQLGFYLFLV